MVFYPYYITCSRCKHRNRLARSPRESIELALRGKAGTCKGKNCTHKLKPQLNTQRPMMRTIKAQLESEGVRVAKPGSDTDWHKR